MAEPLFGSGLNENVEPQSREFEIHTEFITLGQLVKALGLIGMGGEIRAFLEETEIEVNGEPENRRGRKLYEGDRVTFPEVGEVLVRYPE
ncbi:MAG: S4 domain-containing protein YaaA [Fimbriimonadaceae bacterium]|nr:S4 domain-containing protein YaaA [Fimbriimonadaceae bacterium]